MKTMPVFLHASDRRINDLIHNHLINLGRYDRSRGVGAHAAGVGTLVIVEKSLVVLTGSHRKNVFAVHHNDETGFFAVEVILNDDTGAGVTEFVVLGA